jgi:hypothetical protein
LFDDVVESVGTSCSRANVLSGSATLAKDEALQAAIPLPGAEALPNLWAATLDEVFPIRVMVNPQIDCIFVKNAATMELD